MLYYRVSVYYRLVFTLGKIKVPPGSLDIVSASVEYSKIERFLTREFYANRLFVKRSTFVNVTTSVTISFGYLRNVRVKWLFRLPAWINLDHLSLNFIGILTSPLYLRYAYSLIVCTPESRLSILCS